ncbi:retrovirus-related pol polyprotein from transposon TNT 1-94 [Tanacetum coccineum]
MTKPSWIDAMQEEIHEFERLQVLELVSCLDKVMLIKLKWIYKVKTDDFGGVLKNKARLAQGFRKEEGINFEESFAPVLKKALYGLKQAPSAWYNMLSSFLISQYFSKGAVDPTLFTRKAGNGLLLAKPTEKHLNAVKQIFRYLKGTINMRLCWFSKKQKSTAILSTEAEYIALSGCSKHDDLRYHFINEHAENKKVELYFVWTEYQLADISTKTLPRERFNFLIEKLDMRSTSQETLKRLIEEDDE